MKKGISIFITIVLCTSSLFSQVFEDYFLDKTLRIDYIFGGNQNHQVVLLDELSSYPIWAGRRTNLNQTLLKGNGQIQVYDVVSEQLIYVMSFSTLFQEWLSTDWAKNGNKSFENVFLIPFPKEKIDIKLVLYASNGEVQLSDKHQIDPNDILIHKKGEKNETEFVYLHRAKAMQNAIDVVILAEGYTVEEMDKFLQYAQATVDAIFQYMPFKKYKENFNFVAVKSVSEESGVSVPRDGIWRNTAVSSHFDTFYSERYLTSPRVKKMHDLLAGIPYEHIIVLANTTVYGGGGIYNAYTLTTAGHALFQPVVVHEFGHSFAGLADEYFYKEDVLSGLIDLQHEPWEQNITTLMNFDKKWKNKLEKNTPIPTSLQESDNYKIGVYPILSDVSIYTGAADCRMKTNHAERFCLVCQDAIERLIRFYIDIYR